MKIIDISRLRAITGDTGPQINRRLALRLQTEQSPGLVHRLPSRKPKRSNARSSLPVRGNPPREFVNRSIDGIEEG